MENTTLYKELNNIPLADDDPQGEKFLHIPFQFIRYLTVRFLTAAAVIPSDGEEAGVERHSLDSMSSRFTNDSSEHPLCGESTI